MMDKLSDREACSSAKFVYLLIDKIRHLILGHDRSDSNRLILRIGWIWNLVPLRNLAFSFNPNGSYIDRLKDILPLFILDDRYQLHIVIEPANNIVVHQSFSY